MAKSEIPWRLIVKDGDAHYKLCSFWGWNKDETLNFKIYSQNNGQIYELENVAEEKNINPDGSGVVTYNVGYKNLKSTNFFANKHTFHPSGFVHETDNSGKRFKDGIRSISFSDIKNFHQLMLILPKHYENFPTVNSKDFRKTDVIFDANIFDKSPFQIEVFIVIGDSAQKIYPTDPEGCFKSLSIYCGENQKYLLFVRCSQTVGMLKKNFPPHTFVATCIAVPKGTRSA